MQFYNFITFYFISFINLIYFLPLKISQCAPQKVEKCSAKIVRVLEKKNILFDFEREEKKEGPECSDGACKKSIK